MKKYEVLVIDGLERSNYVMVLMKGQSHSLILYHKFSVKFPKNNIPHYIRSLDTFSLLLLAIMDHCLDRLLDP